MNTIKWFMNLLYNNIKKKYMIFYLIIVIPIIILLKYLEPMMALYIIGISLSVVYNRMLFQEFIECNPLVVLILYKDMISIIAEMIRKSIKQVGLALLCSLPLIIIVTTILDINHSLSFKIVIDIILFSGLIFIQLILHMQLLFIFRRFVMKIFDGFLLAVNSICINFYLFNNFYIYGFICLLILVVLIRILPYFINKERFISGGE